MKAFIVTCILLNTGLLLYGQNPTEAVESRPLNGIYIGLLGDASLFSVNYERLSLVSPKTIISSKLGFGYNEEFEFCLFGCETPDKFATIPHHITANFGKKRNFFEIGLGATIVIGNTIRPYLLYPIVGYRHLPLRPNGFIFRVFAQIPFSGLKTDDIIFIPLGFSLGLNF